MTEKEIEKGFNSYIETLLWSSVDAEGSDYETLEGRRAKEDFDPQTLSDLKQDFIAFVNENYHLANEKDRTPGIENFAHNFWLTRNNHGVGFWDGDYINGDELTEASEKYGVLEPYVGDDKKVYIMGEVKKKIDSVLDEAEEIDQPSQKNKQ